VRRLTAVATVVAAAALTLSACSGTDAGADAAEGGSFTIAIEGPWTASYTPLAMTIATLEDQGYTVEQVLFDSPETLAQAVTAGEADFGFTSAGTVMSVVDAGAPVTAFLGITRPDFVMVAKPEITACEDMDGQRLAIHSREGTTGSLTSIWLENVCPGTEPEVLVVAGSENRMAGLIADQIDASPIDLLSWTQMDAEYPGQWHTVEGYGDPSIVASYFFATDAYLDSDGAVVQDFVDTYLTTLEGVQADPSEAQDLAVELLPEVDEQVMRDVTEYWATNGLWPGAEGISDADVEATIAMYSQTVEFETITGPADLVTTEFVDAS
jgi:ABC-type nitrate/sulfonate/bicarbonate transport system substrate-binding protein